MDDILYLHGWGEDPHCSPVAEALQVALPNSRIHLPSYHPHGDVRETRISQALTCFHAVIDRPATSSQVRVVGYSFGGLLAALLAQERPDKITKMLLLAPAIDNAARNFAGDPSTWKIKMPLEYVEELRTYPARPKISCPTTIVHGRLDNDEGGSDPDRIEQWAREQSFTAVHFLPGVGHSLEPWLSCGATPSIVELLGALTSPTA